MVRRHRTIKSLHIPASGGSEHLAPAKHAMRGKSDVMQLHWEFLVSCVLNSVTHVMDTEKPTGTNCVAFSIECKIPAPKRKKTAGKSRDSDR